RIITCLAMLPYVVMKHSDGVFSLRERRGQSILFGLQRLLELNKNYSTVLVGWTGEVRPANRDGLVHKDILSNTKEPQSKDEDKYYAERFIYLDEHEDVEVLENEVESLLTALYDYARAQGKAIEPVWIGAGQQGRWRTYAESIIWPCLHYISGEATDGLEERAWWADYVRYNEAYAEKVAEVYQQGDIIWIHDYHLLLLPQLLRQKLGGVSIGFFMHAPFPSSEYFRALSHRKQLLDGMLGSNVIGFHNVAYGRHFISSCARILGFDVDEFGVDAFGSRVAIVPLTIGIDVPRIESEMRASGVEEKISAIRALYPGKKILVGRDRLDSVHGLVQKLRGIEMFLTMYPEWSEKFVFIQVTTPAYFSSHKIEKKVSDLIARINGEFSTLGNPVIVHYHQHITNEEYYSLLRVADLGLFTTLRDGVNTTSLEYVVCQQYTCSPAIFSEFTGTVAALPDAIQINPWDASRFAQAIHQCLTMSSPERKKLESRLLSVIKSNSLEHWVNRFLDIIKSNIKEKNNPITPALNKQIVFEKYKSSKRRLFLFDYDGTLTPIVKDPSAAIPAGKVLRNVQALSLVPENNVWIISGRDQAFLETYLGDIKSLGLSAEHGSFLRPPESDKWINLGESIDMSWQDKVISVFQYFTERTPGSFIERKRIALTWHYRRADPDFGAYQARKCRERLEEELENEYHNGRETDKPKVELEVMRGKANLEVRPRFLNKGEICKRLVEEYPSGEPPDFVLCMGDDHTDEDMFRQLQANPKLDNCRDECGVFTATVGPSSKPTAAKWHLLDPYEVIDTLSVLN
ncbi:glycosyltransferase family 20 protein, partial [Tortispora caseinolytica NRRL Y-17796]